MRIYPKYILIAYAGLMFSSCKKFIENEPLPQTLITEQLVFDEDATATAAINGIYNTMSQTLTWSGGSFYSITLLDALYADEMRAFSSSSSTGAITPFYFNSLVPSNGIVTTMWGSCYNLIYAANRIIEGLNLSTRVSTSVKKQLTGEAYFIRAFCHFYLVNVFGDVPYITTTDYRQNTNVFRKPASDVYNGIIADLLQAKSDLSDSYPGTGNRVRANKWAAVALLSRAYLFKGEWTHAEEQATEIINNTSQYELLSDLKKVFLKNSREAIWQIIPSGGLYPYTEEGASFILYTTPTNKWAMTDGLFNAFENSDKRKINWIDTLTVGLSSWYFPYKYKQGPSNGTGVEYSMVLRLAEQYLIRAEARAMQDKLTGANSAVSDINIIRHRASLGDTPAATKEAILNAIMQERRVELFTEWGHRFFDLKRWNRADAVLSAVKLNWNPEDALWPIPQSEILANSNLTQNAGY